MAKMEKSVHVLESVLPIQIAWTIVNFAFVTEHVECPVFDQKKNVQSYQILHMAWPGKFNLNF